MAKRIIFQIHLWLGLLSGIVVFIVSITGCIYVFNKEITSALRYDAIRADEINNDRLPEKQLMNIAEQNLPQGQKIDWINIHNSPYKNHVFYSYKSHPEGVTYFSNIHHYKSVFINPYSGEVEGIYDEKMDFFNIVKFLHWSLLLKTSIGQPIVGWSTLIFVILLISGLVLWWPKSVKSAKNLFRIKWRKTTGIYKKYYDLHNVLGFWGFIGALIVAFTGMIWAFSWFKALIYIIFAGTTSPPSQPNAVSVSPIVEDVSPLDKTIHTVENRYSDAAGYRITFPADSSGVFNVYVQQKEGQYAILHHLQFDQYSGALLEEKRHEDKNTGEKLITANYDIHTGAILGLPGKIIAFIVSLISASLPVTGFMMWWKRKRKKKKSLF